MIIDIHTHTFPDKIASAAISSLSGKSHTVPFRDGTVSSLLASSAAAGIDLSVIVPVATSPKQVMHINDSAHQINQSGQGLLSFASMHPMLENPEEELERIAALGFKGIKIHPIYQGVDLDDPRFLRIFRRCRDLGLIVITHTGYDIGFPGMVHCSPEMARHALDLVGPFSFILAHMGGWREWDRVVGLLKGTGACIDTAFSTDRFTPLDDGYYQPEDCAMLTPSEFTDMVRSFGTDRVLFGSDSPWSDQKESLRWIRKLPLSDEEKQMILGENAARLLSVSLLT